MAGFNISAETIKAPKSCYGNVSFKKGELQKLGEAY